jgi:ATP-binding cassette, subfamily B, bacterial
MTQERAKASNPKSLSGLLPFLKPYRGRIGLALCFLVLAAMATLAFPLALRSLIDGGLVQANQGDQLMALRAHFGLLFAVAVALGLFSAARFYMVSWLGERVTADLRNAVYHHVLHQSPEFFETTQTGEVLSRLSADTTLVQTVVGSSLSMGLRNLVMGLGALGILVWTNPVVMLGVAGVLVLIVVPSVWFGRRVRRLSRASQDRIADSSAIAAEVLNAIPVVQSYTAENRESQRFTTSTDNAFEVAVRRARALGAGGLYHHCHLGRAPVGPVPGHAGGGSRAHHGRASGADGGVCDHPGQCLCGAGRGLWRLVARRRRH